MPLDPKLVEELRLSRVDKRTDGDIDFDAWEILTLIQASGITSVRWTSNFALSTTRTILC